MREVITVRMTEAISLYLDYLQKVARRSPRTIAAYRLDLARFARFLDAPQRPLETIDAPTVENWVAAMHAELGGQRKPYGASRVPAKTASCRPPT